MTSEMEFTEFAVATSPRLRRAAFLLCGDWHTAEDLVQTTLAKVFVSWRRAGIRIRRRRRALGAAGSAVAVAVIAIAIPAVTGALGNKAAVPSTGVPPVPVVYAVNKISGTVTPIETATGTAGRPACRAGFRPWVIAITPDGTTACVA